MLNLQERRALGPQLLAAALTLLGVYGLKLGYSRAGADELWWVLGPSCFVAQIGGVELIPEAGAGYISHSARMVVGPACAGVNFLLTSWLALYACLFGSVRTPRLRTLLALSALCWVAAYATTVLVNGVRITLAAQLLSLDMYDAVWTKDRAHRLLGVVLYSGALLGVCELARRLRLSRLGMAGARPAGQPLEAARGLQKALGIYLGVVLGIPLLNRAFVRDPAQFAEHAAVTVVGSLSVALLFWAAHRLCSRHRHGGEHAGPA